jgi:hypothetical protein
MTYHSVGLAGVSQHLAAVSPARKSLAAGTQSFADQLSRASSEAPSKFAIDSQRADLTPDHTSSQKSVTRQSSVTTGNTTVTAATGFNALVQAITNVAATMPATAPAAATSTPVQSADDVYWSNQPAAVQKLRNIDDYSQRAMLAGQLAAQGYSIDTPVMVWGWNASKTTQLRQGFGYSWIPSAMQSPVTAAPGIVGAGNPYDSWHPPQGSIGV